MKKETIITAVIFLAVGFLAGYITDAQMNWNARRRRRRRLLRLPKCRPPEAPLPLPPAERCRSRACRRAILPLTARRSSSRWRPWRRRTPRTPTSALKLANFLYDQKQYNKAIEWYQRALELDPKNVNARTDLGTAYFYTGRPQDALREYDKSLAIDPKHEPTLLNAIVVNLEGTHDLAAAQKAWDRLHKLNPNHPALAGLKEQIDAARAAGSSAGPH